MRTIFNSCVKNAFQAAHADISTGNGFLNIVGCPSVYIPGSVNSILPSLVAIPQVITITPNTTAANSNSFMITQLNQFLGVYQNYIYNGDNIPVIATAASEIAKIIKWVNEVSTVTDKGSLQVTATDNTTYVTLTASVTNCLFTWVDLSTTGVIISNTTNAMLSAVTIASNTTANPSVFTTSAAHGLSVGQVITITTSDATKFVAGTYRVASVPLTTTLTLTSVDGATTLAGTATATGAITLVAQQPRGQGSQIVAISQIPNSSVPWNTTSTIGDVPIAADTYTTVIVNGAYPDGDVLTNARSTAYTETFYFDEKGANFAAFMTQLRLSLARQLSAGVVDAGLVA